MPNVHIIIPARMGSTRLYGKPLLGIQGMPLIQRVWEQAMRVNISASILVATDHLEIVRCCQSFGAAVIMTSSSLQSGTDRVAAVSSLLPDEDIIVNLQGDLPFVDPRVVEVVVGGLEKDVEADICTPANMRDAKEEDWKDPSAVKAVLDSNCRALFFSRSPIPSDIPRLGYWYHHFGIYAFRSKALQKFTKMEPSALELGEGLEQLRALEAGMKILVEPTPFYAGQEINTVEDLEKAQNINILEVA